MIYLGRHEIAFVFGQLSHPHAIPSLVKVLQNSNEAEMVRHEAAEALGGIAEAEGGQDTDFYIDGKKVDVVEVLKEWMTRPDAPLVVKQSCQVAIDMWEVSNCGFTLIREFKLGFWSSTKTQTSSNTPTPFKRNLPPPLWHRHHVEAVYIM